MRIFDLAKIAHVYAPVQVRAFSQSSEGTDIHTIFQHRAFHHGHEDNTIVPDLRIPDVRVRSDLAAFANDNLPLDIRVGMDNAVFADLHACLDIR